MTHRRFIRATLVALALTAVSSAVANASGEKYDGYKSGYPTLRALHSIAGEKYDGYKSGYPALRAVLHRGSKATVAEQAPTPRFRIAGSGFHWSDAAVGAASAATTLLLIGLAVLVLGRRRFRVALKP